MTKVVNIYKDKYDVYGGRPGKGQEGYFGNPIPLKREEDRVKVIQQYREYFYNRINTDPEFKRKVEELRGKRIACFCMQANKICHLTIIVEYLEGISPEEQIKQYNEEHKSKSIDIFAD